MHSCGAWVADVNPHLMLTKDLVGGCVYRGSIKPCNARQNTWGKSLAFSGRLWRPPFLSRDLDLVLEFSTTHFVPKVLKYRHICVPVYFSVLCIGRLGRYYSYYFWVILRRLNFIRRRFFLLTAHIEVEQIVPKLGNVKIRRQGNTKEKEYAIWNKAKV